MHPDLKPSHYLSALIALAAACAPVKPSPPPEPTQVRYCQPEETDMGDADIPSIPNNGDSILYITGDPLDGVSEVIFTRRGNTICAMQGTLNFGSVSEWSDPRG